jgi:hypothetical protein
MGTALNAIAASIASEWRALDVAGLQFWQRDTAQLVLLALVALAALMLLMRAAIARQPGRDFLVLPAVVQVSSLGRRPVRRRLAEGGSVGEGGDRRASQRRLLSAGAQIDVSMSVLSALELMLSVGAGVAVEDGRPPRREVMVSLKVLR